MAYPGNFPIPVVKGPRMMKSAKLTPDDFEQLAAAFRPSWELDDAPFTGAGALSPADVRALQSGGGTHADVRSAVQAQASNGVHPVPAPAAAVREPEARVIVEHGITAADIAAAGPPPPTPALTPMGPPVVMAPAAARAVGSPDRLAKTRIVNRMPAFVPPRESTGSFDLSAASFRSRRPMWIGLLATAAALGGVGFWFVSGKEAPPAAPVPVLVKTVEPTEPAIPPPPPETATVAVATPPPKPAPITPVAAAPVMPPLQAAQPPAPLPPPPRPVATFAPQPPRAAVPMTPRPVARQRPANATIVHDVPF